MKKTPAASARLAAGAWHNSTVRAKALVASVAEAVEGCSASPRLSHEGCGGRSKVVEFATALQGLSGQVQRIRLMA